MQLSPMTYLWHWYKSLSLAKKVIYPFVFGVIYGASVMTAVLGYWLKTDMGYNLFSNTGWHSFSKCMIKEFRKETKS